MGRRLPVPMFCNGGIYAALRCLISLIAVCGCICLSATPGAAKPKKPAPPAAASAASDDAGEASNRFSGNISWYGIPFHGKKTASGRIYDMNKLTCAHRSLPFGTKVLVENPRTGKSVIVEVIDRGPFVGTRVMDVSREAARQLGTLLGGIAYVNCLVITDDQSDQSSEPGSCFEPIQKTKDQPQPESQSPAKK